MPTDRNYAFPKTRSVGFRKPKREKGDAKCTNQNASDVALDSSVSNVVVSPAISEAVSLNSGREKSTTEITSSQPSNQPGGHPPQKPNCYKCKHRLDVPGSAHSQCGFFPGDLRFRVFSMSLMGQTLFVNDAPIVKGHPHGIARGWFSWPIDFDPCWLESCQIFESKEPT